MGGGVKRERKRTVAGSSRSFSGVGEKSLETRKKAVFLGSKREETSRVRALKKGDQER